MYPAVFGPFMLIRPLGRGGMAEVFVATSEWPLQGQGPGAGTTGRAPTGTEQSIGALKRLRPEMAGVQRFERRFMREAELMPRLLHLNVVQTYRAGIVGGRACVFSELVLGKDIGKVTDRLRDLKLGGPVEVAVRVLLDGLLGLAYVHTAVDQRKRPLGIIHRDITPGNILLGYDGVARIADFGLARASIGGFDENLTNTGELVGTPHFLAPELVRGEDASASSDLYGLAAAIYALLTGHPPHRGTIVEALLSSSQREAPRIEKTRPDLPMWLSNLLHSMLERDPANRPQTAGELIGEVIGCARESNLLVPRAIVGRWMSRFFAAEKRRELEEQEYLITRGGAHERAWSSSYAVTMT